MCLGLSSPRKVAWPGLPCAEPPSEGFLKQARRRLAVHDSWAWSSWLRAGCLGSLSPKTLAKTSAELRPDRLAFVLLLWLGNLCSEHGNPFSPFPVCLCGRKTDRQRKVPRIHLCHSLFPAPHSGTHVSGLPDLPCPRTQAPGNLRGCGRGHRGRPSGFSSVKGDGAGV